MTPELLEVKTHVYDKASLVINNLQMEAESQEYAACRFTLNQKLVLCRTAKITPKKVGQFVTFWKRVGEGPIEPFGQSDSFDFYVINTRSKTALGQFVFPKSVLIQKGILSTDKKEGKRGFRVYPIWDHPHSQQARKTQQWQLGYFYEVNTSVDLNIVKQLYRVK